MSETCTKNHDGNTYEGRVVSVIGDRLTTMCSEGKQHCHTMAKDAKVTCDGKAGKVADLKAGTQVRVTTRKDDKNVATAVESGTHHPHAQITKMDPGKGTVTVKMERDGKEVEKIFDLAEDIEYMDSAGNFATIDFFTSGDLVLIVESEGTLTSMKKNGMTAKGKASKVADPKSATRVGVTPNKDDKTAAKVAESGKHSPTTSPKV